EQPDVLDGDDRLVGESLDEGELSFRKRANLSSPSCDHADQGVFPKHRDGQNRAHVFLLVKFQRLERKRCVVEYVGNLDRSTLQRGESGRCLMAWTWMAMEKMFGKLPGSAE